MKIIVALLIFVISLSLFFLFYKPDLRTEFQVTRVSSDTTFQNPIWRGDDGYGKRISLRVVGELDNKAELFIQNPKYPERFFVTELPKGTFDIITKGEYYEEKAEAVFLHKKAKKGKIKIIFTYITSD